MASNTASIEGCPSSIGQANVFVFADMIKKSLSLATAVVTTLTTSGSITDEDYKIEAGAVVETEAINTEPTEEDDADQSGAVHVEDSDTDGASDEEASAMLEDLSFIMDKGTATAVELMIELMQTVVAMKEMYSKSSRADQEALSSQITIIPDAMCGYYGLFFNLFESSQKEAVSKCYYLSGRYTKSAELCSEIPESMEAQICRGKALYHSYRSLQRQLRLNSTSMDRKEYFSKHKVCYDMAREVVKIFGHIRDVGYASEYADLQRMLDFAMIDYFLETNKLKDLNRCFLCLKNISKSTELKGNQATRESTANKSESVTLTETGEDKRMPQAQKKESIHASHLIPHSIVKKFAQDIPKDAISKSVVFGGFGTKLENMRFRTPATCTVYLLCSSCEHMLNVEGEQPCLKIVDHLYNPTSCEKDTTFTYGTELYHFCIGLIFRTLCPSQDDYINTDEVYDLLVKCREFLTAKGTQKAAAVMPNVFLFICPVNVEEGDASMSSFLVENSVSYTSKIGLDCPLEDLGTFESVLANFFIVKVGVVVILVKFKPTADHDIPTRFCVNPTGGCYTVPAGATRKNVIPIGVWTVLCLLHDTYKADLEKMNTESEAKGSI